MLSKKTLAMELLITVACAFLFSACGQQPTNLTMQLTFAATIGSQVESLDLRELAVATDFFAIKAYRQSDGKEIPILTQEVTDGPVPPAKTVTIELDDKFIQGDQIFLIIGTGIQQAGSVTIEFQKIAMDILIVPGGANDLGDILMEAALSQCIDNDGDGYGIGNCTGPDCNELDPQVHSDCYPATTTTTTSHPTTTTTTLPQVTYTNTTKAVIDAKCTMCHGLGGQSPNLTNYASVFSARSRIKTRISVGGNMRQYLTAQQAQTIINWIDAGAPQ